MMGCETNFRRLGRGSTLQVRARPTGDSAATQPHILLSRRGTDWLHGRVPPCKGGRAPKREWGRRTSSIVLFYELCGASTSFTQNMHGLRTIHKTIHVLSEEVLARSQHGGGTELGRG